MAEIAHLGIALAIVTSKHRESALRGIDLCGLMNHFPVVVTPEDVIHAKPHPEPVVHALRELRVSPADALFVGDSPHDVAAGRGAGTRTAGALWGPFPRATLEAARPNVLLERPADVLRLLLT